MQMLCHFQKGGHYYKLKFYFPILYLHLMNLIIQILFLFYFIKDIQISYEIYVAGVFSDFSVKLSFHFVLNSTHLHVHNLHLLCSEQQKKKCSNCFIKCL